MILFDRTTDSTNRAGFAALFVAVMLSIMAAPQIAVAANGADELPDRVIAGGQIEKIINQAGDLALFVGGFLVVVALIVAGVRYLTAGSDEERVKKAKATLRNWLIGAIIVIGVGIIIKTLILLVAGDFFNDSGGDGGGNGGDGNGGIHIMVPRPWS